jgi:hypothetical protein
MSAPDDSDNLRAFEDELIETEREHEQTVRIFRELEARRTLLLGTGVVWQPGRVVIRPDGSERDEGRQAVRAMLEIDGRVRFVDEIDAVERRVLLEEIEAQLGTASRPLLEARRRLANARIAVANTNLEPAVGVYRLAVADLDASRRQAEDALGAAIARLTEYGRARDTARRAARKLGRIAADGCGESRETVEQLRNIVGNGDVPVRLSGASVESDDGPDFELLDDDPTSDAMWRGLGDRMHTCVVEPDRAEAQLRETQLGRAAAFQPQATR